MANFSDFIKSEKQNENIENSKYNDEKQINKENLEDMINNYSTLSQDELLSEFMKLTIDKKKKGVLDENELNTIKSTIEPFLNNEQKSNLDKILNMVRNV
jgi:hypothetical protein